MNRTLLVMVPAACLALSSIGARGAENWPSKPLRVIVPYGAGSTTDIIPRVVFEQLSPQLGQSIIVDNRAGAGGTIGSSLVARATPDGYTILCNSSAHTIAPSLYTNLNYHPARDFAAVVPLGLSPAVLVVTPSRGYRTAKELVAAAKSRPGGLSFSSVGNGSGTHLSAEKFRFSARLEALHIPFKGGADAQGPRKDGRSRRRADGHDASGVRCARRKGDRGRCGARQSYRAQTSLMRAARLAPQSDCRNNLQMRFPITVLPIRRHWRRPS